MPPTKKPIFSLRFDFTIFRVVIEVAANCELDLSSASAGNFDDFIGFEKKIFKDSKIFVGERISDITRSVDWVFIHRELITRQAHDVESDVLYSLSTVGYRVGWPFQEEALRPEFHPVNKSCIDAIRVRITDGRNNPLNPNGLAVALSLMVEEEP